MPFVLHVTGRPGAGKGTQAARLAAELGFAHYSVGQLMRDEAAAGGPLGRELGAILARGALTPPELAMRVVGAQLARADAARVALDGFPRTAEQAAAYEAALGRPALVLELDCPAAVCEARLRGRAEGRADDAPETVRARLAEYEARTAPGLAWARARWPWARVDAAGPPEAVWARVRAAVEAALAAE